MEQSRAQGADVKRRIQQLVNQAQRDSTKKNQAENVKRQFQESVSRYQSVEGSFRKKFRNRAERQFRTIRPDAPEDEVKNVVDEAELGNTQILPMPLGRVAGVERRNMRSMRSRTDIGKLFLLTKLSRSLPGYFKTWKSWSPSRMWPLTTLLKIRH